MPKLPVKNVETETNDIVNERRLIRNWRHELFLAEWAWRVIARGALAVAEAIADAQKAASKRLEDEDN